MRNNWYLFSNEINNGAVTIETVAIVIGVVTLGIVTWIILAARKECKKQGWKPTVKKLY